MGSYKLIPILVLCLIISGCECDEKTVTKQQKLTKDHKSWFALEPAGKDSTIVLRTDNQLTQYFTLYDNSTERGFANITNTGSCDDYREYETRRVEYFSRLGTGTWLFYLTSRDDAYEFNCSIDNYIGTGYTACRFVLNLNNLSEVKQFSYYPYSSTAKTSGMHFIGDTTIRNNKYTDVYSIHFDLPSTANSLDVTGIYLSKSRGLVAYRTRNNAFWQR